MPSSPVPLPSGVPPAPFRIPEALLLPVWNGAAVLTSLDPQLALRRAGERLSRRDARWAGYREARIEAEQREAQSPGDPQRPGLDRILDRLVEARPEWGPFRQIFLSVELECWMELTQPHPLAKTLYQAAIEAGQPVCFVEDTPFSPLFVQMVLQKCGYERVRHLRVTHGQVSAPGLASQLPPPLVPELDGTVFLWTGALGGGSEYVHQPLPQPAQPIANSAQLAAHRAPDADPLWAGLSGIRTLRLPQSGPEAWFAEEAGYQVFGPLLTHWALGLHLAAKHCGYATIALDDACPRVLLETLHRVHVLLGGPRPDAQGFPVGWDRQQCWPQPDRLPTAWLPGWEFVEGRRLLEAWLRAADQSSSPAAKALRRGLQAFVEDYLRATRSDPVLPKSSVLLATLERLVRQPHELEVAALQPLLQPARRSFLDRLLGRGTLPSWPFA